MNIMEIDIGWFWQEILFWAHLLFIFFAVAAGLFLSPLVALLLVILHRAHIFLFGECLLSKIQRKVGSLPKRMDFLQMAVKRFSGKEIGVSASRALDYSLAGALLAISVIK